MILSMAKALFYAHFTYKTKLRFNKLFFELFLFLVKLFLFLIFINFLNFKMLYIPTFISIIEVLLVTAPVLLTVAFVTVAGRKTMARKVFIKEQSSFFKLLTTKLIPQFFTDYLQSLLNRAYSSLE